MASAHLLRPPLAAGTIPLRGPRLPSLRPPPHPHRRRLPSLAVRSWGRGANESPRKSEPAKAPVVVEEEEDLPWVQEKAMDLVEFTGTVTQAIPGPRVGQSPLPWLLAIPIAYAGVSFVIAVVKAVRKLTSPRARKKRLVNRNAFLLKSIDELFQKGKVEVHSAALKGLMQKLRR